MPRAEVKQRRAQIRAEILSALSRKSGLTQAQIAKRIGVPCYSIARMLAAMVVVGDLHRRPAKSRRPNCTWEREVQIYSVTKTTLNLAAFPSWLYPGR